jgi:hypothetical protein
MYLIYFMWWQLCIIEAVASTSRMFNIVSNFECVIVHVISFHLKFIVCHPDPKMCIYTDNVCKQEVFQISFPRFIVREPKYEKSEPSWWKKHTALPVIQFSKCDISIHTSLVLYIPWCRISGTHSGEDNAVWVRTLCSVVHDYECFGGTLLVFLHRQSEDGDRLPWRKPWYPPVGLHSPITRKTIILNVNILHSANNWIHILGNRYALLFYIIFWCEQKCVGENIM